MTAAHTRPRNGSRQCPTLLTPDDVARILQCSSRHVYRLRDTGFLPLPIRLGRLLRWHRETIESWMAAGCPKQKGRPQQSDAAR